MIKNVNSKNLQQNNNQPTKKKKQHAFLRYLDNPFLQKVNEQKLKGSHYPKKTSNINCTGCKKSEFCYSCYFCDHCMACRNCDSCSNCSDCKFCVGCSNLSNAQFYLFNQPATLQQLIAYSSLIFLSAPEVTSANPTPIKQVTKLNYKLIPLQNIHEYSIAATILIKCNQYNSLLKIINPNNLSTVCFISPLPPDYIVTNEKTYTLKTLPLLTTVKLPAILSFDNMKFIARPYFERLI